MRADDHGWSGAVPEHDFKLLTYGSFVDDSVLLD